MYKINYFKLIFVLIVFIFIWPTFVDPGSWNFLLSNADLAIHEGGHFLFMPFGNTLTFLGGSIFQIIFPLIFVVYFYVKNQKYSSGIVMVWLGHSIINMSVYMKDAIVMQLPLVGGGQHDWNYLFNTFGIIDHTYTIAASFRYLGYTVIIVGLLAALFFSFEKEKFLDKTNNKEDN